MLEVRGLSASYGKHRALENAALRVGKGEIVVILGANGAGKTTLLKAICGICEGRVSGSVTMDGTEILGLSPDRIVEEGIALVPEGRGVFADLTVQENLALGAYPHRARDEAAGNLERVLALFPKLAERRRQVVRTMSGGEQQMVAIGRAMMSNPAILILDEPSLGLSPLLSKDLFQSLKAVRDTGLGILLVEQNAKQSLRVADRGYLLENGEIVHDDEAKSLAGDPAVQKAYLGGGGTAATARAKGPSPAEIAAAALKGVGQTARAPAPPAPRAPEKPRAAAAVPDTSDFVARAASLSSRKTAPRPAGATPPAASPRPNGHARPAPTAAAPTTPSGGRLAQLMREIEEAARRAESYRPTPPDKRR